MTKRDGWMRVSLEMGAGLFVVIASAALFNLGGWSGTWFRLEAAEAAGVTPPYDLSVTKVADPSPEVIAGAVLTYTVKVSNAVTSTIPTDYIKLTDVLDPGAAGGLLRSLTAPPGWVCGEKGDVGGVVEYGCSNPDGLAVGEMDTFTLVLSIPPSVANNTVITNTATVMPGTCPMYEPCDLDPSNDSAVVTTTVKTQADLVFDKTAEPQGPIFQGTPLTYTLMVTNNGPSDAQDVKISDIIPNGAGFVFHTVSSPGTCVTPAPGASGPVVCTWPGPTPPGGMHSVVIVVQACKEAPCGELTNVGSSSSSTSDPNGSNDSETVETQVVPVPAPVLSPLGVLFAVLILFGLGGWALHRRRPVQN